MFKKIKHISKNAKLTIKLCIVSFAALLMQMNPAFSFNELSLIPFQQNLPASSSIKVSPSEELYVTHRDGFLSRYTLSGEMVATYSLGLTDLYNEGQGGLLDIAFHPEYKKEPWIYFSYAYGEPSANGLKVIRVKLSDASNSDIGFSKKEDIFSQRDLRGTAVHYGARLAFLNDNSLLITTGDGFDYREKAQVLSSQLGKILRVTDTGDIPSDNPFADAENPSQQFVYSLGHRNPQGIIIDPSGKVIAHEHGPDGGDELNIIEAKVNYGWPVITKGKDYIGSLISPFTEYESMQQPGFDWTPSIAPSGMTYYRHSNIPQFTNRLLLTSLKFKQVHSFAIENAQFTDERIFFNDNGNRLRDITSTRDGRVFILTDGNPASILEVQAGK